MSVSEDKNYRRIFTIGYQYGRLISPGNKNITDGIKARIEGMNANMKRSEGGRTEAENRKAAAAYRKANAKRLWDELIAAGKPKHELAQVVAKRMDVDPQTVRRWSRSGWK